jgi:hypothetical protein
MILVSKISNSSEKDVELKDATCFGTYAIDCYNKISNVFGSDSDLIKLLCQPARNANFIEFYSPHNNLKIINNFPVEDINRIQDEVNEILSSAINGSNNSLIKSELALLLSKPNEVFSNGSNHMITWGYSEIVLTEFITTDLEIIDIDTYSSEATLRRKESGGVIGDLTISLIWDTDDDLDLYVYEPDGHKIGATIPKSLSGGRLDVDANYETIMHNPMENIFWDTPPKGNYIVNVECFLRRQSKDGDPINFSIEVIIGKQEVRKYSGVISTSKIKSPVPMEVIID